MHDNQRNKGIIKTSIIGILANLLLSVCKVVIGLFSRSIAIVLDAVNNISDAASSIITIIGTKLAGKAPDKKHPFGYGRIEYLSAMIISLIILYAGITSLVESVKKIITPQQPDYSLLSLIIIAIGVFVKIVLGLYVKAKGKTYNSMSLENSGKDALLDSIISASTLVAAIIFMIFGISLEAWLGAIISVLIIKSGCEMLIETLSEILGERAEASLVIDIKKTIKSFENVYGAYDLVLNNYGPDSFNGSVHIEIPDTYTAEQIDNLARKIQLEVYNKHKVLLTAIGVYAFNTKSTKAIEIRNNIAEIVKKYENVLQFHGFYDDEVTKTLRFDLVISFDSKDRQKDFENVVAEVQAAYPDYKILAAIDIDYSEVAKAES